MVRRWSCVKRMNARYFQRAIKKWKRPLTIYKKIMKFNKYKFLKLWKARTSKRRRYGNFRINLTYVRFFYGITQWAYASKFRACYKNYIWLISNKRFKLPLFERYSYLYYNNIYIHPLQTQNFYHLLPAVYGQSAPLIEHRLLYTQQLKKKFAVQQFTLSTIFICILNIILQLILNSYKILMLNTFYLLNDS